MKLITEYITTPLKMVAEETNGEKNYFIEGIFMQAEDKNRNGRIYRKSILESAVNKYNDTQVKTGRAVGELNHPAGPTINLDKVSHAITELRWEGNNVVGKAKILNTPMGEIVKGLLEGGVQLGVSSRGMGDVKNENGVSYVGENFHLATVDIVQDPSAHNAFVNGIMEGVEYEMISESNGIPSFKQKEFNVEDIKSSIKNKKKPIDESVLLSNIEQFIDNI